MNLVYRDLKIDEMSVEILKSAVKFLRGYLEEEEVEEIKEAIDEEGLIQWCIPQHHGWGMQVRNVLRAQAGLPDSLLPDRNWDDYYIQVIEIAVGKRPYEINGELI